MASPRQKKLLKTMKNAKKCLTLKVESDDMKYEFDADLFDLTKHNIGVLSEEIAMIPGQMAFVLDALGEFEKDLARVETEFEVWRATRLVKYFSDGKVYKSEKDKENNLISKHTKEYTEYKDKITAVKRVVATMKAYKEGIMAKHELAQTLSANIRSEQSAYNASPHKGEVGN